jgi:toxin-antitoxin system PIN domain toxin
VISCDTNILFPACDSTSHDHDRARAFLAACKERDDFCLCEQVLMELYCLLRNPTVCRNPLSAPAAADTVAGFRSNPHWSVADVVLDGDIMKQVWQRAATPGFPYARIFDLRLGFTLRRHGVTEFATRNRKDFADLGFDRVWDPIADG